MGHLVFKSPRSYPYILELRVCSIGCIGSSAERAPLVHLTLAMFARRQASPRLAIACHSTQRCSVRARCPVRATVRARGRARAAVLSPTVRARAAVLALLFALAPVLPCAHGHRVVRARVALEDMVDAAASCELPPLRAPPFVSFLLVELPPRRAPSSSSSLLLGRRTGRRAPSGWPSGTTYLMPEIKRWQLYFLPYIIVLDTQPISR